MKRICQGIIVVLTLAILVMWWKLNDKPDHVIPQYDANSDYYYYAIYANEERFLVHDQGGTVYVAARESEVADREIEMLFQGGCAPAQWELMEEDGIFLISWDSFEDGAHLVKGSAIWTRIRVGIEGQEAGSFRFINDFSQYGKDVIEVKYGKGMERATGSGADSDNLLDQLTIHVNGEPQVVDLADGAVQAVAVPSDIADGEIELLLPYWDGMTNFWWLEEESEDCYVIQAQLVANEVENHKEVELFAPNLQKIRLGVKDGAEGNVSLSVGYYLGGEYKINVSYRCDEGMSQLVPEIPEELAVYEASEKSEELVVYLDGEKLILDASNPKLETDKDTWIIEFLLPIMEGQVGHWRYERVGDQGIRFDGENTQLLHNSLEEGPELLQKLAVHNGDPNYSFVLIGAKENGEETKIEVKWNWLKR